jgi:curved DNA-binding protein
LESTRVPGKSAPRGKTWGDNRTAGSRVGTEEVNFDEFSDFNSFLDQLLGRKESRNGGNSHLLQVHGMTFAPVRRNTLRHSASLNSRDVEARLTLPLEKAYQGGYERIRLEDGRSLEVKLPEGMYTGQSIRLREQGIAGAIYT